jgi:hypothetical protein
MSVTVGDSLPALVVSAIAGVTSCGLMLWSRNTKKSSAALREAAQNNIHDIGRQGSAYALVCGPVLPMGEWAVATYSGERTVASKTHLRRVWSERTTTHRHRVDQPDAFDTSEWRQREEVIGQAVTKMVPFFVIHTFEDHATKAQVQVAVRVQVDSVDALPLLLRYSRALEETSRAGPSVVINNSNQNNNSNNNNNNSNEPVVERRNETTLRDEYLLPGDGATSLTIFGHAFRDSSGTLVISNDKSKSTSKEPWICTWQSADTVVNNLERRSKMLKWAGLSVLAVGIAAGAVAAFQLFEHHNSNSI